jgi:2-isopropylmalate synthase
MEEVVMGLKQREDHFHVITGINTREFVRTSKLVSSITGVSVQPNKAIVGANAFAHSSGIHQDGVLKERSTYEIIDPREVGVLESSIVLTARSGRHALRHRLAELGYELDDDTFEEMYARFLTLADKKKQVFDGDLEAMMTDFSQQAVEVYHLEKVQVVCGEPGIPTCTVEMVDKDGEHHIGSAHGDGPIDAIYHVISQTVGVPNELTEFSVNAVTEGTDALGEVTVRVRGADGRVFTGRGAHPDIVVACARAYTNALNRLLVSQAPTVHEEL